MLYPLLIFICFQKLTRNTKNSQMTEKWRPIKCYYSFIQCHARMIQGNNRYNCTYVHTHMQYTHTHTNAWEMGREAVEERRYYYQYLKTEIQTWVIWEREKCPCYWTDQTLNFIFTQKKNLTTEWPFFSWFWYTYSIGHTSIDYCLQECVCNQGKLKSSTLERTLGDQASGSRLEKTMDKQSFNYVWISKYFKHRLMTPLRPESQQAIYSISHVSSNVNPRLEILLQWT